MTEIPKSELPNHFNKEIIVRENSKENVMVFEKIDSGWLCGISITNSSAIQILIGGKQDEHSAKYYSK